ncbi:MAG: translation elongation factor Ts [Candidatus Pacebacteria bacterium]|nr:translation elongation factor Ts [Candidatus Paceibacterota bacterium]
MSDFDLVKQLRDETGVSVMECKKALDSANNDYELAKQHLVEQGMAKADKKSDRLTKTGYINSFLSGNKGALLELRCETDFVSKHEDFQQLAKDLAEQVVNSGIVSKDDLLNEKFSKDEKFTVLEAIKNAIAKFGENMEIGEIVLYEVENGFVSSYIHTGGRVATLVSFETQDASGLDDLGLDIAMQIAAMQPKYLSREDIPAETIESMKEEYSEGIDESKPEDIKNKILEGRLAKKYEEICLLDQKFIKDDSKTITQLLKESGKDVVIKQYIRLEA